VCTLDSWFPIPRASSNAMAIRTLRVLIPVVLVIILHFLIDLRFGVAQRVIETAAPWIVVSGCVLALYASKFIVPRRGSFDTGSWTYWIVTWFVCLYLVASHVEAIVTGALSSSSLRTVSGVHLMRSVCSSFLVIYVGGLKPDKAWYVKIRRLSWALVPRRRCCVIFAGLLC
jgi:hypothetical protein